MLEYIKGITQSLQQMLWKVDSYIQKNEIAPFSYTTHTNSLALFKINFYLLISAICEFFVFWINCILSDVSSVNTVSKCVACLTILLILHFSEQVVLVLMMSRWTIFAFVHHVFGAMSKKHHWGTNVAQSFKPLTQDFSFGHDIMGLAIEPHIGLSTQLGVCLGFLSPSPSSLIPTLCL